MRLALPTIVEKPLARFANNFWSDIGPAVTTIVGDTLVFLVILGALAIALGFSIPLLIWIARILESRFSIP
jgi:hypothetical protein